MKRPKEFKSREQQIEHLKSIGLIVEDESYAKSILSRLNYYRLINAYSLGLYAERTPKDKYKAGVSFNQIYGLYKFDSELRRIISALLEEFEIQFRTVLAYQFGKRYGAVGYLETEPFISEEYHNMFIEELEREKVHQAKSPIVKHHREKYDDNLPIWALVEVVSFGAISKLYKNLKPECQKAIAKELGTSPKYLNSWLRSLVEVRNICAHYGRIYNRTLLFPPRMYKDDNFDNKYIFSILFILKRYTDKRLWINSILKLTVALKEYKSVELSKIGFPENWVELLNN